MMPQLTQRHKSGISEVRQNVELVVTKQAYGQPMAEWSKALGVMYVMARRTQILILALPENF